METTEKKSANNKEEMEKRLTNKKTKENDTTKSEETSKQKTARHLLCLASMLTTRDKARLQENPCIWGKLF